MCIMYVCSTRRDGRVDIGKQANRHVMNYYVINKVRDLAVCVFMEIQCAYNGQGIFDVEYCIPSVSDVLW